VYHSYLKAHPLPGGNEFFYLGSAVAAIAILFKVVPLFASILISICGQEHPARAIYSAHEIYRGHTFKLFLSTLAAVGICVWIHLTWHQMKWEPLKVTWQEGASYLAILWYLVAKLSLLTLVRLTVSTRPP
jgi:hypothetical protein